MPSSMEIGNLPYDPINDESALDYDSRQGTACYPTETEDWRLINGVEKRYAGFRVLECRHPETGQRVVLVGYAGGNGKDHVHSIRTTGMQGMVSVISESLGRRCIAVVEGRVPASIYRDKLYPGERHPVIDAEDIDDAVLKHGGAGLMTAMARQYGREVISSDQDRNVILQMVDEGFSWEDIGRYLLFRQIPQWARTDPKTRPPLGEYLQKNVIDRFTALVGDVWGEFVFSLYEIMGMDEETLNEAGIDLPQEVVEAFLEEGVGVTFTQYDTLTRTQKVALRYNQLRNEHFFDLLFEGWGDPDAPNIIAETGVPHLYAIAGQLGERLSLYPHEIDPDPDLRRLYSQDGYAETLNSEGHWANVLRALYKEYDWSDVT